MDKGNESNREIDDMEYPEFDEKQALSLLSIFLGIIITILAFASLFLILPTLFLKVLLKRQIVK